MFPLHPRGQFAMHKNERSFFVIGQTRTSISRLPMHKGICNVLHKPWISKGSPPHHHAIEIIEFCKGVFYRKNIAIPDNRHGYATLHFVDRFPICRTTKPLCICATMDRESIGTGLRKTLTKRNECL